jgi:hypothetical protein
MSNNRVIEADRYMQAAIANMTELAAAILLPSPSFKDRLDETFFELRSENDAIKLINTTQLVLILTAMEEEVIKATIAGEFPVKARSILKKFVDKKRLTPDTELAIYINYIVDKSGNPPTKKDIKEIH